MAETRRMQRAIDTLLESAERYELEGNPARAERYRLLVALRPRLDHDLQRALDEARSPTCCTRCRATTLEAVENCAESMCPLPRPHIPGCYGSRVGCRGDCSRSTTEPSQLPTPRPPEDGA